MSANNFIHIQECNSVPRFKIYLGDADFGYDESDLFATAETLEEAIKETDKKEKEYADDGMYIEYGVRVSMLP